MNGLIVSCQAGPDNPLHGPVHMQAMAMSAVEGGATGIRANGPSDIEAIRQVVDVPIIGINKVPDGEGGVIITPDAESASAVSRAGATIIALDATSRPRRKEKLGDLFAFVQSELGCQAFADVATLDEGLEAEALEADFIATTLSGYTPDTAGQGDEPDLQLVGNLAKRCSKPVIAEGRYRTPVQVRAAFDLGASAVVVGTAITNPRELTRWFSASVPGKAQ